MFQSKIKLNKFSKICCIILVLGILTFAVDVTKSPEKQLSAKLTIQTIQIYKKNISPIFQSKVKCVYQISCSDYTVMAIEKYGFVKGLYLSIGRITHCRKSVGPLKEWERP